VVLYADSFTTVPLPNEPVAIVGSVNLTSFNLNGGIKAANLRLITGALRLSDRGVGQVAYEFPSLEVVGGTFELANNIGLAGLDANVGFERAQAFGRLRRVDGDFLVFGNGGLAALGNATDAEGGGAFPSLATVSGNFSVASNGALASLAFPSLATVEGSLAITGNPSLGTLSLPLLRRIVGNGVTGNAKIVNIQDNSDNLTCEELYTLARCWVAPADRGRIRLETSSPCVVPAAEEC
jgi:hypothetical protein